MGGIIPLLSIDQLLGESWSIAAAGPCFEPFWPTERLGRGLFYKEENIVFQHAVCDLVFFVTLCIFLQDACQFSMVASLQQKLQMEKEL